MKKIFTILAVSFFCLLSCQKSEIVPDSADKAKEGITTFVASIENSKIAIGEKDGTAWKAIWENGDQLKVTNASTSDSIGIATLQTGAGTNIGTFTMTGSIADGTSVVLVYGDGEVPTVQKKGDGAEKKITTTAKSQAVTVSGGTVTGFTMAHTNSVVRVSLGSTTLAGATVSKLYLRSIDNILSGVDKDYVEVDFTTPVTLSATAKDIFFTVNSVDLTGKEIYVAPVVTAGKETYTLPVGFKGKAVAANTVCAFDLSALDDNMCANWYEPHERRLLDVPGYAYGEANTFFVQCKNGSTYTGATYSANASIPDEVAISIKARGDFLKVVNPIGSTFEWGTFGKSNKIYTIRTSGYEASNVDPTKYTINYDKAVTVTVKNTGAYAGAPILLMKKGDKVLWSWTFWNIAADGTVVESIQIGDYKLANMDLGQATTKYSTWIANKNEANPDPVYRTVYRYQYGRHMPIMFETYWSLNYPDNSVTGNVPVVWGSVTLEQMIQNPVGIIANKTINTDLNPMVSDNNMAKAWGGCAATTGTKAVLDPCPKGWRVADKAALQAVKNSTITAESTKGYPGLKIGDNLFMRSGTCTAKTTSNNSSVHVSSTEGGGADGSSGTGKWWSNYNGGATSTSSYCLTASASAFGESNYLTRSYSCSVRCQVDDDKR